MFPDQFTARLHAKVGFAELKEILEGQSRSFDMLEYAHVANAYLREAFRIATL